MKALGSPPKVGAMLEYFIYRLCTPDCGCYGRSVSMSALLVFKLIVARPFVIGPDERNSC